MMHVRRLEKPQRVAPERQGLSVLETAHPIGDAESARVELDRKRRADELGFGRCPHEAVHPAVLVAFPVQQRHVSQRRGSITCATAFLTLS